MSKITASQVSDFFLAFAREHGDSLTNLKLQKLLYYAQGWYLGIHGKALFDEELEAWIHGPVVPSEYRRFKAYGFDPINGNIEEPTLPKKTREFLIDVYGTHARFSAWDLERATHEEPPWKAARGNLPLDANSNELISKDSMKMFFKGRVNE